MARKTLEFPDVANGGPGVAAPPRIREVDAAIEVWQREVEKRSKITPREIAAKQDVIRMMHKHSAKIGQREDGSVRYCYDEDEYVLQPGKETLRRRAAVDDSDDEE